MSSARGVGSGLEASGGGRSAPCSWACHLDTPTPEHYHAEPIVPTRNPYALAAAILASVLHALRDGADSSMLGDTSYLTYAQGWTAAATLAQLAAGDAMAELISPSD
jgi:hypothetical protein